MASLAAARATLRYGLAGLGVALLSTVQLQLLLADRLQRDRITQLGPEVLFQVRLGELALDRLPPEALARLSGLPLRVGAAPPTRADRALAAQGQLLRQELCREPQPCPAVLPAAGPRRGVWVQLLAPLEPVWLLAPIPPVRPWPADPWLLLAGLGLGGSVALLLFFGLEVQRPLQWLQRALAAVGAGGWPAAPLAERGTTAVRQLTGRFNAMVRRLEGAEQERAVMLAGIAHDLNSPITRLRLRLGLAGLAASDLQQAEADLAALERITSQFLLFAGGAARAAAGGVGGRSRCRHPGAGSAAPGAGGAAGGPGPGRGQPDRQRAPARGAALAVGAARSGAPGAGFSHRALGWGGWHRCRPLAAGVDALSAA